MSRKKRRRTSSWKSLRAKFRMRRKLRIFLLSLITVFIAATILSSFALLNFFKAPLAEARGGIGRELNWDGERHINLAVVVLEELKDPHSEIAGLRVLSIEPAQNKVSSVEIPVDQVLELPLGFGERSISDVYALGSSVAPESNISLVIKTLGLHLDIPVDGYLLTDKLGEELLLADMPLSQQLEKRWERSFYLLRNLGSVHKYVRTNLNFKELARLANFFWKVRNDRTDLAVWTAEEGYSQTGIFCEQQIEDENFRIMVLNGTMRRGLAGRVSEVVECLCGNVIKVGNDQNQHRLQSVIFSSNPDSYTVKRLAGVLGISAVQLPSSNYYKRGDIVIVLGEDYGR